MLTSVAWVVLALVLVVVVGFAAYSLGKRNTPPAAAEPASPAITPLPAAVIRTQVTSETDLNLIDDTGEVVISSAELSGMPRDVTPLSLHKGSGKLVTHLASELFKGAVTLPNKTVEIVFKKSIQDGLKDGTYTLMTTKTGEVLADAVTTNGKQLVGKGRIVQSGQVKQLAAGAFQLVSIAVAQSHLADIERTLSALNGNVEQILDGLEASEIAKLKGSMSYLEKVAAFIRNNGSPEQLPQPIQGTIADIVRLSDEWREKLIEDVGALKRRIEKQGNADLFGSESTYKSLLAYAKSFEKLNRRHDYLVNMIGLLNLILAYIDPQSKNFVRADSGSVVWREKVEDCRATLDKKTNELVQAAFTNDELLRHRRADISNEGKSFLSIGMKQQDAHDLFASSLQQNLGKYLHDDNGVRVALSFDVNGAVKAAGLL